MEMKDLKAAASGAAQLACGIAAFNRCFPGDPKADVTVTADIWELWVKHAEEIVRIVQLEDIMSEIAKEMSK